MEKREGQFDLLRQKDRSEMKLWLTCFIKGVIELQEYGIFHADLLFRNTIKVQSIYKIIDFDISFKVIKNKDNTNDLALEKTKEVIRFWLGLDSHFDQQMLRYMLRYH